VLQVGVQLHTPAVNVPLPAFAAKHRTVAPLLLSAMVQSIDISCLPGAQQQTCSSSMGRIM